MFVHLKDVVSGLGGGMGSCVLSLLLSYLVLFFLQVAAPVWLFAALGALC